MLNRLRSAALVAGKPSKPLLLPCGNLKLDTLETLLANGGVQTEPVEVYETVTCPDLQSMLSESLAQYKPSYIVYFSPSGVDATLPLLRDSGLNFGEIKVSYLYIRHLIVDLF